MPPTFAQPVPARAFTNIARNSGDGVGGVNAQLYASLAGTLQHRYASDADRAAREGLGYAQLENDTMLRQNALGLQSEELQQRGHLALATIEAHANAQMQQWVAQQRFTLQDRQELTRQENAVGEILSKYENGEISAIERDRMLPKVANRVNFLQAKDQHNKAKAENEMVQAHAKLFQQQADQVRQKEQNDQEFAARSMNNSFNIEPDMAKYDQYATRLQDEGENPSAPDFKSKVEKAMLEGGDAYRWYPTKDGKGREFHPLDKARIESQFGKGRGSSSGGGQGQDRMQDENLDLAIREANRVRKDKESSGGTMSDADWEAEVGKYMNVRQKFRTPTEEKRQKVEESHLSMLGGFETQMNKVQSDPFIPDPNKRMAVAAYSKLHDLVRRYPPGSRMRTPAIEKAIGAALDDAEKAKAAAEEAKTVASRINSDEMKKRARDAREAALKIFGSLGGGAQSPENSIVGIPSVGG